MPALLRLLLLGLAALSLLGARLAHRHLLSYQHAAATPQETACPVPKAGSYGPAIAKE